MNARVCQKQTISIMLRFFQFQIFVRGVFQATYRINVLINGGEPTKATAAVQHLCYLCYSCSDAVLLYWCARTAKREHLRRALGLMMLLKLLLLPHTAVVIHSRRFECLACFFSSVTAHQWQNAEMGEFGSWYYCCNFNTVIPAVIATSTQQHILDVKPFGRPVEIQRTSVSAQCSFFILLILIEIQAVQETSCWW